MASSWITRQRFPHWGHQANRWLGHWAGRLALGLVPPVCQSCHDWLSEGEGYPYLCQTCLDTLPWLDEKTLCPRCGQPPHQPSGPASSPACGPAEVDQVFAVFGYQPPLDTWIHHLKYEHQDGCRRMLGYLAARSPAGQAAGAWARAMIPVPLHPRRMLKRGFNQSLALAQAWGAALDKRGLPRPLLWPNLLTRRIHTQPQMSLQRQARLTNVATAFAPTAERTHGDMEGRRVLLVDDVMTTGSTLNACARVLKEMGAAQVGVLVWGRAESHPISVETSA
ncbi:MAG: ComF family protein [Deltaproteobacteria bacterium]|nr:ComF family protein [Deltaproteobacteria bacterium]